MAEPRETSRRNAQEVRASKIQAFRETVQKEHDAAVSRGEDTFSVHIQFDLPLGWEEEVAQEWRREGWTVTRKQQHTDSYLYFA